MSDCPTCGNQSWLCQQCKMDEFEDHYGTAAEQNPDHWILEDGLWHASMACDGDQHTCACGTVLDIPVTRVTQDLRYVPDKFDAPVCRKCAATIEGARAETVPDDATFERASEIVTDGGRAVPEAELVDRAVREAATLVEAGDSEQVAVEYVVDEHELDHRRDDINERVHQRLEQRVAADGGCEPERRDAFFAGDAHWCDLCDQPFDTLAELIRHDCDDNQTMIADGGRPQHHANCEDCPWSYSDEDLVDVSDEMDRHARKEMHDVDLKRAVATDGGQEASAYVTEEVELKIRGNRVHVQALLAVLSVASDQLSGSALQPAADLAGSVPEQAVSLEDTIDTAHSMMASDGEGWDDVDPTEALDVEFVSVVDDQDDQNVMTDGGVDQSSNDTDQSNRRKSPQPHEHSFPDPIGRSTPFGSSREAIAFPQLSQRAIVVGRSCNNVIGSSDEWADNSLNRTRIQLSSYAHILSAIFQRSHCTLQPDTDHDGGVR